VCVCVCVIFSAAARHVFFQVDQNITAAAAVVATVGGTDPCHPGDAAEPPSSPPTIAFVEGVPGRLSCVTTGGYPPPEIAIKVGADDVTNQFVLSYVPTLCGERGLRLMVYETQRFVYSTAFARQVYNTILAMLTEHKAAVLISGRGLWRNAAPL